MAKAKGKARHASVEQNQAKQQKQITNYEKNQRFMKWIAIILLILLLLALLAAGYATDWTRGLNKDSGTDTTTSDSLDSAGQPVGTANGTGGGSGGGSGGGGTSTTTNSTTTNNTISTNPPDGGSGDDNSLLDELTELYNETGTGANVDDIISRANSLGIDVDCHSDLLTRDCTFSAEGENFSVRSLLGTGLITSILDGI